MVAGAGAGQRAGGGAWTQFAYLSLVVDAEEIEVVAVGGHPPALGVLLIEHSAPPVYCHLRGSANAFLLCVGGLGLTYSCSRKGIPQASSPQRRPGWFHSVPISLVPNGEVHLPVRDEQVSLSESWHGFRDTCLNYEAWPARSVREFGERQLSGCLPMFPGTMDDEEVYSPVE